MEKKQDTRHKYQVSRHKTQDISIEHPVSSIKYQDTRHKTQDTSIEHPSPDVHRDLRFASTSSIEQRASSIEYQVSSIKTQDTSIKYQDTRHKTQDTSIEHPSEHRASSIEHQAPSIQSPLSALRSSVSDLRSSVSGLQKLPLFGKTLDELTTVVQELGLPKFTAKQITDWLYKKEISTIDEMSNLSKAARAKLSEIYEVGLIAPVKVQVSADGTKKYLFPTAHNKFIETAMIPDKERKTVCVSSQVGCKMGCLFCMTGKQGFNGQLTAGEIVNQIRMIEEFGSVTNIVYMGMGEPFDNLDEVLKSTVILTADWGYAMSPRRITVSSIGIVPALKRFLAESDCNLAISVHTPFDQQRQQLMPVQHAYPLKSVLDEIRSFNFDNQRKLSFEYIVFGGLNDTPEHVKEMTRLFNGIKSHVNLIRFHPIPGTPLNKTDETRLQEFKDQLNNRGILTTIRASRGMDIYAACGLLSTKELVK